MSELEFTFAEPVAWPVNRPRENGSQSAKFHSGNRPLTFAEAINRLERELAAMTRQGKPWRTREIVVSTNYVLRTSDGRPRSGQREPADTAVALHFLLDGEPIALQVDRFDRVPDNIAAIAAHIDALRGQERWGVGSIREAFAGYRALPPPGNAIAGDAPQRPWSQVFTWPAGTPVTAGAISKAYRQLAKERQHDEVALRELNVARDEALQEANG